ncbi:hypothetical protein ACXVUM_02600 [Williamsia sp. SKLECPSW1]
MTSVRAVCAAATVGGLTVVGWVLGWPGWSVPPIAAASLLVVAVAGWPAGRRSPRRDAALAGVAVAVLVAALATTLAVPRAEPPPDTMPLRQRAATAVTDYLTVTTGAADPGAVATRLRALTPMLTDRALDDLRSQGPDSALPGAVATGATQQITVQSVGLSRRDRDSARLLVYATARVTIPSAAPPVSVAPITRWAVMRRVDDTWRLADLYPVGPGG